jgi:flagellar hook-associated protein 3 FlgL
MSVITGINTNTLLTADLLTRMRKQLDDLQQQLATGKKAQTYGGLGIDRGLDVDMRASIARIDSYTSTISTVQLRVQLQNISLDRMSKIGGDMRNEALNPSEFQLVAGGQTLSQINARNWLDEALSMLNQKSADRYLFSGRATDKPATDTLDHILNGNGTAAGLKQVMSERLQADQGADGRGRLLTPAATGSVVTLEEDGAHPFGFKLAGATTNFDATITGPSGSPASLTIDLAAGNPPEGGKVHIQLNLPDGSSSSIDLTATSEVPPPAGSFAIGATPGDTAINLAAAIDTQIQHFANTDLAAASAAQASHDFFAIDADNPPQRVDGPPFETATALRDATATDTVHWYVGDDATDDPRKTAIARIDDAITVNYGIRGNEEALRNVVQNLATFAATSFSPSDTDARDRYVALARRVGTNLAPPPGIQKIEAIQTAISGASLAAGAAKQRIDDKRPMLQGVLDQIENASPEEVSIKILALNTQLQAALQTTALLSRLSLVNFL